MSHNQVLRGSQKPLASNTKGFGKALWVTLTFRGSNPRMGVIITHKNIKFLSENIGGVA